MKISGFTIIKDGVVNDYPVKEAILSILPVVDEMIVSIGKGTDDTEGLIRSIGSDKIKIVHSVWDPSVREGGRTLAVETDKAFGQIDPKSDWAFYIQADEVVHEKYHAAIRKAAELYLNDKKIDGLLFNYLHFYGTYDYVGDSRKWYNKEVRIIRNDSTISSYRDAQGFRREEKKLAVKPVDAYVYHYGWVKDPYKIKQKFYNTSWLWMSDEKLETIKGGDFFDYNDFDSLNRFKGTHPRVMQERISKKNWELELDIHKKKFSLKDRLLYWIEKMTGRRLFAFRNYKIV
jgi:hypothetical protein